MQYEKRYLKIEEPDRRGVIDFLSHNLSVIAEVSGGRLYLTVQASENPGDSSWDLHEFEIKLPEADR
jgi:hypothetical protein